MEDKKLAKIKNSSKDRSKNINLAKNHKTKEDLKKQIKASECSDYIKYQEILESISDAFFVLDKNLKFVYFNKQAEVFLKRKRKDVLGKHIFNEVFKEAKGSIFEEKYTYVLKNKKKLDFETFFNKEPYVNWYNVRVWPFGEGISVYFTVTTEKKKREKEIKDSYERFEQIANNSEDVLWMLEVKKKDDYIVSYVSPAFEELWGVPIKNLTNNPQAWFDSISKDDKARVEKVFKNFISGKGDYDVEYDVVRPDGSVRTVISNGKTIKDKNGRIIKVSGIIRDITKRKKTEEKLKQSEEKYRSLFENAGAAIFIMNVTEKHEALFHDCNDSTLKLFGCTHRNQIIGKSPLDFSPLVQPDGELSKKKVMNLAKAVSKGHPLFFEWLHHSLDGTPFWVEVTLTGLNLGGKIFMQAVVRDITVQNKMREERKKLISLHEINSDFVGFADYKTHVIEYINPAGRKMVGIGLKEDVTRYKISDVHSASSMKKFINKAIPEAVEKGIWRGDILFLHKDGHEIPVSMVLMSHRSSDGKVEMLSTVSRDITEKKKIEHLRENLIRDVTHTLKTPIATAKMAIDRLDEAVKIEDKDAIYTMNEMCRENLNSSLSSITSILESYKLESGIVKLVKERLFIKKIMEDYLKKRETIIKYKHLNVILNIAKSANNIYASFREITLLMENIIDNSIKFTDKGNVTITVKSNSNFIHIEVKDTGCGISAEIKNKIMDRFYQRHPSIEGVGIGLTICFEIVKRHKGNIEVVSKGKDKGTTVIVKLPKSTLLSKSRDRLLRN